MDGFRLSHSMQHSLVGSLDRTRELAQMLLLNLYPGS
jgi:hypothetical protein